MAKNRTVVLGLLLICIPLNADVIGSIKEFGKGVGKKIQEMTAVVIQLPEIGRKKLDQMVKNFWGYTPYLVRVAKVHTGLQLSSGEERALTRRQELSGQALEKKFGSNIFGSKKYVPKIALLASGGGYRAMLCTMGFLAGAQRAGVLDMITWMAGVSGGTWGIATVLSKALSTKKQIKVSSFCHEFATALADKSLAPSGKLEMSAISNILLVQAVGHQFFTSINLYGALIANRIFSFLPVVNRQRQRISDQASLIESGKWPIPIYTAVQYTPRFDVRDYQWIEFNPWQFGGTSLDNYAPIWGISRRYQDGVSVNYHFERSLGFILGICGSAFAAEVDQLYDQIQESLYPFMRKIIEKSILPKHGAKRVAWAQLYNFTKGMKSSSIKNSDYLNLIDAGLSINLPYPPVSGQRPERTPDILIMLDSSLTIANALHDIERYAKKHKLKLPSIDYKNIDTRSISVFVDEQDASVPVVVYMPRITDRSLHEKLSNPELSQYRKWVTDFDLGQCTQKGKTCDTFNFKYSYKEMMQIMKTIEFQTIANRSIIFDAIENVMKKKTKSWWKIWQQ